MRDRRKIINHITKSIIPCYKKLLKFLYCYDNKGKQTCKPLDKKISFEYQSYETFNHSTK